MNVQQEEYKVKLEVFEGPLDLLLYLIKKEEVDVYNIPIERITNQYMEYLNLLKMLDLNIAGEFLVMAATLMMIKSRMLLPPEERGEGEEEEEEDPRWDLVRQLVEYKKFKDAALHLQHLEIDRENVFWRSGEGVHIEPDPDIALQDVSIFDLITAFNDALSNVKEEELKEIFTERFTVGEKIDAILGLLKTHDTVSINQLFKEMESRQEIICTFLGVLELIRLKQIEVCQDAAFSEIVIMKNDKPGSVS
ncbi:MAG: chromosome segregation protein ScpA [Kiritimatiellae bacterium]|nr:chromosome segregation protein ScpA [Kiritimatiellia bacterium]